jgi:hypothetical protein
VSAVSPDCDTKTHMSSRKMGARRSSRSDASSRETWRHEGMISLGTAPKTRPPCHRHRWQECTSPQKSRTSGHLSRTLAPHRSVGELLDGLAASHAGVVGGAAGDEQHAAAAANRVQVVHQPPQPHRCIRERVHRLQGNRSRGPGAITRGVHRQHAHAAACCSQRRE